MESLLTLLAHLLLRMNGLSPNLRVSEVLILSLKVFRFILFCLGGILNLFQRSIEGWIWCQILTFLFFVFWEKFKEALKLFWSKNKSLYKPLSWWWLLSCSYVLFKSLFRDWIVLFIELTGNNLRDHSYYSIYWH